MTLTEYLDNEFKNIDTLDSTCIEKFRQFIAKEYSTKPLIETAFNEIHKTIQSFSIRIVLAKKKSKEKINLECYKQVLEIYKNEVIFIHNNI